MAALMDNLLLHAWQRKASERFLRLILRLQCAITSDVPIFHPQSLLALGGACKPALEFRAILQLLLNFSRRQPIQTTRMAQTTLGVVWSKAKVLILTLTWLFGIIEKPQNSFTPTDFTILGGVWNMAKELTKTCIVH
jgi:hypothetical protein